ncbi:adenosine deaminase-like protein isoform X2 [Eurosta solidaginis]
MSKMDYMVCVLETIIESMKTEKILVRLLPSIDRAADVAEAMDTVNLVLELLPKYDNIITGIDFSGNPKVGKFEYFMPALTKARQHHLKLAIHCGEIDNPSEIDQMIQFGMDRCGHGTFLSETQLQELGSKKIPIECCLTSNVKCRTVNGYEDHHFKHIFNSKVAPVILCTDDCGVFDTTLSKEFALAQQIYNLTNDDLDYLLMMGLENAFLENRDRIYLLKEISPPNYGI